MNAIQTVLDRGTARTDSLVRRLQNLSSGHWYHELLVDFVRDYNARHAHDAVATHPDPLPVAAKISRRASREAALLGTGAAAITTGAGLWIAQTNGLAALPAVPTAAAAMFADMLTRTRVMLRMTCDLAALFGIRFDPDDPADLAQLHAVARDALRPPKEGDHPDHDRVRNLVELHPEQLASAVGLSSLTETLTRDVIPVVGLAASGFTSYRGARQLAETTLRYVRTRRALEDALGPIEERAPEALDLVVEGVWLMFTCDGQLDADEAAVMAFLVHERPDEVKHRLLQRMRDDETGWLQRLRDVPAAARTDFLHALVVASAVDSEVPTVERELLERAAAALEVPVPAGELDQLAGNFRDSGLAAPPHAA